MKRVKKTEKFDYIDNTFINLYSKENPILVAGDKTYFLFTNISDIHRPLIGIGTVIVDEFLDSMNKVYFIELEQIIEPDYIINKYLFNKKTILLNAYNGTTLTTSQKVYYLNRTKLPDLDPKFFKENLMRIECFFVRPTYDSIKKLLVDFTKVIKDDLLNQIDEINELQTNYGITE